MHGAERIIVELLRHEREGDLAFLTDSAVMPMVAPIGAGWPLSRAREMNSRPVIAIAASRNAEGAVQE